MEFMTGVKKTDLLELPELQDKSLAGQTVKVNGAVHTIRDMGDVAFVVKETDFCSASTKKAKRDLI